QDIRQSLDSNTIFRTTVESIGTTLQVSRCLLFTRSLTGEVQAIEYRDQLVSSVLGSELINSTGFNLEKIILPEKVMAIANVYNELHSHKANSLHQQLQIKSILAVRTSYLGSGNGLIVLHQCDRYREWTIEDKELLEVVANQVGIAIAQAKLLETEKEQSKELNRKNQDLAQAKQEAEIASLAKSEFLANVSHELRTPLNAILGFSQLMSRDTNLHLKQRETLNIINSSGEHLLKLINDVLEMSRIEAGRETLEIRDFDLQKLLVSLYQMLRLKAQAKRLELIFDCSSQVPQYIKTDEHKLRQILTNLITNGIKFTERGKVSLNVSLKSTTNLSQSPILHFAVTDTGIGIQPAEMAQLFEAFVQTQAGKKAKQGTGLGLAISRKFAQLLGSDIKVKSQWLSGSTFSFDLPVELGNPSEIPTQITETVIGLQPGQTNYRILIVEDIAESRTLLVELLKSIGFQVKAAKNGLEAVNLSADWLPHLIWMDMRMPLMDGYQATRLIKNQAKKMQLSPPVIIALTASALKDKVLDSISAGCDDFVHKPFKENVIFSKMEKYLGVKYLYANSGKLPSKTTNNFCHPQTRKLQQKPQELNLTHLSLAWRENLKQAAIALDETTIKQLISDIKNEHFAIAESLRKLVQKCRFDLI
ncbi:MAG: response regulator, partial [Cyanobacteria bacterium J083]